MAYNNNELLRFLDAQNKLYLTALDEIKNGKKESGIPELWDGKASERIVEILLKK